MPKLFSLLLLLADVSVFFSVRGAGKRRKRPSRWRGLVFLLKKWGGGVYPRRTGGGGTGAARTAARRRGIQVGALNRCHLSNWRFNPETVHFLSSKRPFLPTMFVSKCYKTKHFGQDSLFHKKPKLGRKNHYFYSVKMGERAKSL